MTIWTAIRRFRPNLFLTTFGAAVADVLIGFAFMVGPRKWTASSSYDALKRLLTIRGAGLAFLIVGIVLLLVGMGQNWRHWELAWLVSSILLALQAGSFIVGMFNGKPVSGVPVSPLFLAVFHFSIASEHWPERIQ